MQTFWHLYCSHIVYQYKCLFLLYFFSGITCAASSLRVVAYTIKSPTLSSYTYNMEVTYTCVTGYETQAGGYSARCTAINIWIGNYPTCTSMSHLLNLTRNQGNAWTLHSLNVNKTLKLIKLWSSCKSITYARNCFCDFFTLHLNFNNLWHSQSHSITGPK